MYADDNIQTSFFKVTLSFPKWRSLKSRKGHLWVKPTRSLWRTWYIDNMRLKPSAMWWLTFAHATAHPRAEGLLNFWGTWRTTCCFHTRPKFKVKSTYNIYVHITSYWDYTCLSGRMQLNHLQTSGLGNSICHIMYMYWSQFHAIEFLYILALLDVFPPDFTVPFTQHDCPHRGPKNLASCSQLETKPCRKKQLTGIAGRWYTCSKMDLVMVVILIFINIS